jgi:hypothetical protein
VTLDRADIGELEIRMRSGHTFTISGRVLDASGLPAAGAGVNLSKFQAGRSSSTSIGIDADGRFRATNVQPGSYAIETSLGGPNRPELRRAEEFGFLPIKVEGADVEGLVIVLKRGADVPGLIKLEDPGTDFPAAPGSGLMVLTRLADDRLQGSGSTRIAMVQERAFTLSGMFGRRVIELANVPLGWYVKSIQYGGRDVTDGPIEFSENARASLDVLLSSRGAVVTGRVTDDRGDPVPRAMVFMIPVYQAWGGMALSTYARASATGTFRIGPARAGDYHIVALPASARILQGAEWNRLARMEAVAERITISALEERTIDLRLGAER